MRGNATIRVCQPRHDSRTVYSRWQFRPSLEVLGERLAPSVVALSPPSFATLAPTVSATSNSVRPTASGAPSAAAYAEELLAANRIAADRSRMTELRTIIQSPSSLPLPATTPVAAIALRAVPVLHLTGPGAQLATSEMTLVLRDVPDQLTVSEDETLVFTAWAGYDTRPAGNPHFSLEPVEGSNFPEGAEIDPESGLFTWSPTTGFFAFRVRVQDGNNVAVKLVHLHVQPVMRQALAADDEPLAYAPEDLWADTFDGETGAGSDPVAVGFDDPSGSMPDLDLPE